MRPSDHLNTWLCFSSQIAPITSKMMIPALVRLMCEAVAAGADQPVTLWEEKHSQSSRGLQGFTETLIRLDRKKCSQCRGAVCNRWSSKRGSSPILPNRTNQNESQTLWILKNFFCFTVSVWYDPSALCFPKYKPSYLPNVKNVGNVIKIKITGPMTNCQKHTDVLPPSTFAFLQQHIWAIRGGRSNVMHLRIRLDFSLCIKNLNQVL